MKILSFNNEFPPFGGGTATVTLEFLQHLKQRHQIGFDLITTGDQSIVECDRSSFPLTTIYKIPSRQGCLHHATIIDLLRYAFKAFNLSRKLQSDQRYSATLAWCTLPAGLVSLSHKFINGLPYVVRISGPDIPGFEGRYALIYPIILPILRFIWRNAFKVVCKCQEEVDLLKRVYSGENIYIIRNGVDLEKFNQIRLSQSTSPLRVICVARLIARKGQDVLLRSLRSLRDQGLDIEVDFVGDGDQRAQYETLSEQLGIRQFVTFHGYVERSRLPEMLSKAGVFVLPSHFEGMSVATLEALAAGLPIIATDCGGMRELVRDGYNGRLIPVGSQEHLIDALRSVYSSPDMLSTWGINSRQLAQSFGWQQSVDELIELLRDASLG